MYIYLRVYKRTDTKVECVFFLFSLRALFIGTCDCVLSFVAILYFSVGCRKLVSRDK